LAEGGAENADRAKAMGLDFKVYGAECFHDGHIIRYNNLYVNHMMHIVWLQLKH
jgi:hypothetical protein